MHELQKEWAQWKYFVMARSQKEYLVLRQLFSGNQWSEKKTEQFYQHLAELKKLPINLNAQRNAYEHVWGYFKKVATIEEKQHFFTLLNQMTETNNDALSYLKKLAQKYQTNYLLESHLFD